MATIEDFRAWYERDLSRFAPWDRSVKTDIAYPKSLDMRERKVMRVWIFTDKNRYSLQVHEPSMRRRRIQSDEWVEGHGPAAGGPITDDHLFCTEMDNGYLGCIATSRRWRAGEDWHRGSDLSDGPLTEDTWRAILSDIVGFELVEIAKEARGPALLPITDETPTALQSAGVAE